MSNELIVYTPKDPNFDYDYVAFSFNGKNSYDDFGIYRVSEGSKYNLSLIPELSDKTAEAIGSDGEYYFQTWHKKRVFNINFAFDKMTEDKLREFKRWLNGKELAPLWFAENPYKVYYAKVTGSPTFSALPFEDAALKRVYKGTGTIQFTCYYPYARTPDRVQVWTTGAGGVGRWEDVEVGNRDGKNILQYKYFNNKDEWEAASGLTDTVSIGENPGDLPAPFIVTCTKGISLRELKVGECKITLQESCHNLRWDSKTGLVTGELIQNDPSTRRAINYTGNPIGAIPVGGISKDDINLAHNEVGNVAKLSYNYWYY